MLFSGYRLKRIAPYRIPYSIESIQNVTDHPDQLGAFLGEMIRPDPQNFVPFGCVLFTEGRVEYEGPRHKIRDPRQDKMQFYVEGGVVTAGESKVEDKLNLWSVWGRLPWLSITNPETSGVAYHKLLVEPKAVVMGFGSRNHDTKPYLQISVEESGKIYVAKFVESRREAVQQPTQAEEIATVS